MNIKKMKLLMIFMMVSVFVSGCGQQAALKQKSDNKKISIVCTVFPVYDWVNEIIGEESDNFELTLIGNNGDIHSYQPTAQDMSKIHSCDLLIYIGGNSDGWAKKIQSKKEINSARLFDVLSSELLAEEHDEHEEHEEHQHQEENEFDEHIWMSLKLAQKAVAAIEKDISSLDPENESIYSKNAEEYIKKLGELDKKYVLATDKSVDKSIVVADRSPFRYLAEDYGIKCFAAFSTCSADADADFEVVARLAKIIDSLDKQTVLVIENSSQTVAETVIKSTKKKSAQVKVLNTFQTAMPNQTKYYEGMAENLTAFEAALS